MKARTEKNSFSLVNHTHTLDDAPAMPVETLLRWYAANKRALPWRGVSDPYLIWLSEVILQQTRVEQGLPYYLKFSEKWPTVTSLASATEEEVMRLWEGLGYYSRARNMHATAKLVVDQLDGKFPSSYAGLLSLKGIGPYTAGAIASIAFNEAVTAVDGNFYRVFARHFGFEAPLGSTLLHKQVNSAAQALMPPAAAGDFNQAIMELGATVCKPMSAQCTVCPLTETCVANSSGLQQALPVKGKRTKVTDRYITFFIFLDDDGKTLTRKRLGNDIWKSLYELPNLDSDQPMASEKAIQYAIGLNWLSTNHVVVGLNEGVEHLLSHRKLHLTFITVSGILPNIENYSPTKIESLAKLAFPRPVRDFLTTNLHHYDIQ